MKMNESIEINRPPEAVFEYLRDVSNDSAWQRMVVEAKVTSEGPLEAGSTGEHRVSFMGMTDNYGWKVDEFDPPNRAGWSYTSGPMTGTAGYALDATGGGTTLAWTGGFR